jgi:hypothetical protein
MIKGACSDVIEAVNISEWEDLIFNKVLRDYFVAGVSSTTLHLICEIKLCFMKSLMTNLYWYWKLVKLPILCNGFS